MVQSERLGLNLWAKDDFVNLDQMNENFQKLDQAAATTLRRRPLRSIETTSTANQINISLTDIDWAKCHRLILSFCLKNSGSSLWLNGSSSGCTFTTHSGVGKDSLGAFVGTLSTCVGVILLEPLGLPDTLVQTCVKTFITSWGFHATASYRQLSYLTLYAGAPSVSFAAGSHIDILEESLC